MKKEEGDKKQKTEEEEVVHLRREISLLPAVSFIIGTVVGSGIFIAPKGVLMNSGSVGLSLLVWALCGILSMFGTEPSRNPIFEVILIYLLTVLKYSAYEDGICRYKASFFSVCKSFFKNSVFSVFFNPL